MIVIQKGVYSQDEIIKQLGIKTGPRNKKEKITKELNRLGYKFNLPWGKVEIIEPPADTDMETLRTMLIEKFNMDVRIDTKGFALHTFGLLMDDNYANMPNKARTEWLFEQYGVEITPENLTGWTSRLITKGIVEKSSQWQEKTYWETEMVGGEKIQTKVDKDDPDRKKWYKMFWKKQKEMGKQIGKYMWDTTGKFYFSCLPYKDTRCAWGTPAEQEEFIRICCSVLGGKYVHVDIREYEVEVEPVTTGIDVEMSDEEYEALYGEQTAEPQTQSATKVEEEYEDPWFMRDEAPAPANSKSSSSCFTEEQKAYMAKISLPDVPRCIWKEWLASGIAIESEDDNDLIIKVETAEVFRKSGWR